MLRTMRSLVSRGSVGKALSAWLLAVTLIVGVVGCEKDPVRPPTGGGDPDDPTGSGAPSAAFGISQTSGDAPITVQFANQSTGDVNSFSWTFGDGGSSSAQNPSHVYTRAGSYTVALTVRGPGGSDIETKTGVVRVDEIRVIDLRNAPRRFGPFWPAKREGDCEFGGHGPDVWTQAWVDHGSGNQSLRISFWMKARETQSDWTLAESGWMHNATVYQAPSGLRVKDILSASRSDANYRDTDHGYDPLNAGELGAFQVMGDTGGDDVCNNTLDDTHMYYYLYYLKFRVGP